MWRKLLLQMTFRSHRMSNETKGKLKLQVNYFPCCNCSFFVKRDYEEVFQTTKVIWKCFSHWHFSGCGIKGHVTSLIRGKIELYVWMEEKTDFLWVVMEETCKNLKKRNITFFVLLRTVVETQLLPPYTRGVTSKIETGLHFSHLAVYSLILF